RMSDLPRGCFVAVANLSKIYRVNEARTLIAAGHFDRRELQFGDFSLHGYAWLIEITAALVEQPIPARGRQGVWEADASSSGQLGDGGGGWLNMGSASAARKRCCGSIWRARGAAILWTSLNTRTLTSSSRAILACA